MPGLDYWKGATVDLKILPGLGRLGGRRQIRHSDDNPSCSVQSLFSMPRFLGLLHPAFFGATRWVGLTTGIAWGYVLDLAFY